MRCQKRGCKIEISEHSRYKLCQYHREGLQRQGKLEHKLCRTPRCQRKLFSNGYCKYHHAMVAANKEREAA